MDQNNSDSKKESIYSLVLSHIVNHSSSSYSRHHVILHGSVLLAVLAIYQNSQIGIVSYNNAFFLGAIISAVFAYGLWHCHQQADIFDDFLLMHYDKLMEAIHQRYYEPIKIPFSQERSDQFEGNVPLKEWPLEMLLSRKDQINSQRDHIHFWLKFNSVVFYIGLYASFLFNIAGAYWCFIDLITVSPRGADLMILWPLAISFIFMLFFYIRIKLITMTGINKYKKTSKNN